MKKEIILNNELIYYPEFFNQKDSRYYFKNIFKNVNWKQDKIKIFGKERKIPRLSAWYGDEGAVYKYSGLELIPEKWTEELYEIKETLNSSLNLNLNAVLLNLYRTGSDYMGWHSDDERKLGTDPVIASISFGEKRRFLLRKREDHSEKIEMELNNGSLLLMKGKLQQNWQHSLPKTKKHKDMRINLTYREIILNTSN